MPLTYVKSQRGKDKLHYDGFTYLFHKTLADDSILWRCEKRGQCRGSLTTMNEEVVRNHQDHNHAPNQLRREEIEMHNRLKRSAEESQETTQQILTAALATVDDQTVARLPRIDHMRRNIRRQRHAVQEILPQPASAQDMVIPDAYQTTSQGERFLQYDSGRGDPQRMLIYSTNRNLDNLQESRHWFLDGTFKTVPSVFYQLYTIHFERHHQIYPSVYCLLLNKRQDTYQELFARLKTLRPNLNPETSLMDYEIASHAAFHTEFPNTQVKGCYFHLCQSVYRHIQSAGLQMQYINDRDFALSMKMIPAIVFVPPEDVPDAFEQMENVLPPEAAPILNYFEDTYIGRQLRNGQRRAPLFPVRVWNMTDRVEDDLARTNNSVEGWHRSFMSNVSAAHPTIWKFLNVLKLEQTLTSAKLIQMDAGNEPPAQRRKYRDVNQRITTIANDYDNRISLTI